MERKNIFWGRDQYSGEYDNDRMNSWKGEQISSADTYIEWCFEQKCKQLSNGFDIIAEWRTRKQKYVQITGTTIFDFQHYSRHDATHSISILEAIELLLGKKRVDLLSAGDLWLLLEAAYSHDAGMAMNYDEVLKLWNEDEEFQEYVWECIEDDFGDLSKAALYYKEADNILRNRSKMENLEDYEEVYYDRDWPVLSQKYILILVTEYIRRKHTQRVERLFDEVDSCRETVVQPRLYRVAVMVSQMHGKNYNDIFSMLKYRTKGFGSGSIHPQFAAAMLRIGDLLDIDNNRFNLYAIAHFGRLPMASMLHLKKHKAITHISISESEISAEAHTDEYEVGLLTNDWFKMIENEVKTLICNWNVIVPEALVGCTLQQSRCEVYLLNRNGMGYQTFDAGMQRQFSVDKKKLIKLLIGTSIYEGEMDFIREYLQNAMDASKMQLWIDLENGKYEYFQNPAIVDCADLTPFDLDSSVYDNYRIKISVEWNENRDKLLFKICDQGIGIESDYLNNLSNIGTGWRGRKGYSKELKKMVKWLRPTGGFGIGIQSAFMVTDSIAIFTKSDQDRNGYKIILQSPDKIGSVSLEEMTDYHKRGTTVMMELEPDKIQSWARYINRNDENEETFDWSERRTIFDREKWDEFDPDAVLVCTKEILEQYIERVVPNPIIPIEVACTAMRSKLYRNDFIIASIYWKKNLRWLMQEIDFESRKYQCIIIPRKNDSLAIVWEKKDCIFQLFRLGSESTNQDWKFCFKNVLVRNMTNHVRNMEQFRRVGIFIDFMGFQAEKCLKIHRSDFSDKFLWEKYFRQGFHVLIQFLTSIRGKKPSDEINRILGMYHLQVACLVEGIKLGCNGEMPKTNGRCGVVPFPYSVEGDSLHSIQSKKTIETSVIIKYISEFYRDMEKDPERGILVALGDASGKLIPQIKIGQNYIKRWFSDDKKNGNGQIEEMVLDKLNEFGALCDDYTVKALLSDERLEQKLIRISGIEDYMFVFLRPKKNREEMSLEEMYNFFWSEEGDKGRKYAQCAKTDKYKHLFVDMLPYQQSEMKKGDAFILSPISKDVYYNVKQYKNLGKKLDYTTFRNLVWGREHQENQSYVMLIDWVFKHQLDDHRAGLDEIKEEYEEMLKKIYEECVRDT